MTDSSFHFFQYEPEQRLHLLLFNSPLLFTSPLSYLPPFLKSDDSLLNLLNYIFRKFVLQMVIYIVHVSLTSPWFTLVGLRASRSNRSALEICCGIAICMDDRL